MTPSSLPRILVIDDVYGRSVPTGANREREDLCRMLGLIDLADRKDYRSASRDAVAEAMFVRGQQPALATVGDTVTNDLDGCLRVIEDLWYPSPGQPPLSLLLLDLCFLTGHVTTESNEDLTGIPEGAVGDDEPSGYFGLRILRAVRERYPHLPVAVLSGRDEAPVRPLTDAGGADAFVSVTSPHARREFEEVLKAHGLYSDSEASGIIGTSSEILLALRAARRVAESDRRVLLLGESGTGKELFARYIHDHSRSGGPYLMMNAGTLSEELFVSELFGYERGAHSTATARKRGMIELADGGDLFLDEVATLPSRVQAGILRVIDDGRVAPLGGVRDVQVDVRFLCATNEDLAGHVQAGDFRNDLLARLSSDSVIVLPPLRSRPTDIPVLARHLLSRAVDRLNRTRPAKSGGVRVTAISDEACQFLAGHDWPGNVRELEGRVGDAVRSNPLVVTLHPQHFRLRPMPSVVSFGGQPRHPVAGTGSSEVPLQAGDASQSIGRLVKELKAECLDNPDWPDVAELRGAWSEFHMVFARIQARVLEAALQATRKRNGELNVSGAIKLLLADESLKTPACYDHVLRVLGTIDLEPDGLLQEAKAKASARRASKRVN